MNKRILIKKILNYIKVFRSPYSSYEDNNKCIYIHIPKCGGNAVTNTLFNENSKGHKRLQDYYDYDQEKFLNYYKFTITRNPYARFVSAYEFLKKGGKNQFDKSSFQKILTETNNVNDFIQRLKEDQALMQNISNYYHFKEQVYFLHGLYRGNSIDYIGKQEEMDESLNSISCCLNMKIKKVKKINVTDKYNSILSPCSKDFIYELYKKDFIYLGYEK